MVESSTFNIAGLVDGKLATHTVTHINRPFVDPVARHFAAWFRLGANIGLINKQC